MKKAYFLAGTAILCWSTVAVTSKLLLGSYNNFQVMWISALFAAVFLLVVNIANSNIKKLKDYKLKDYIISILIGLPGSFLYYVFYYAGTARMLASQAFIINYLWPIMSIVFACIILKEKMTVKKMIAIVISFLGVAIVAGGDSAKLNGNLIAGAVFCILGAVSYGVFTALNQKFDYDKSISVMISYIASFALTGLINVVQGNMFIPTIAETLGFVWNGVFTMAIANTVWVMALKAGNTAKISNLAYITPFLSMVWTSLILKEKLNIYFITGLVVIVLGIFIQLKEKNKKEELSA
ncbi:MAG: DMT family transporter [Clostridia bacterium]|nr:DMT family transporter [Clostridia bacterium]